MRSGRDSWLRRRRSGAGFTLVELLVSLTIVVLLSTVSFGVFGVVKKRAMMAREMAAARNLMTSFSLYSADHGGEILPGYRSDAEVYNDRGEQLYAPANARYPWRLYPYIQDVEGSLLFNGNEAVLEENDRDYLVSVSPNLGMNATLVGGHYGSGSLLRPSYRIEEAVGRFCVRHTSDTRHAPDIIVFLSARSDPEEGWEGRGYFEVQPPRVLTPVWSHEPWSQDARPSQHGFVDLRWGGRAVAAMLDGSARAMGEDELRDMRHWAVGAAEANDADYSVHRP